MALGNIGTYRVDSLERVLSDPTTAYRYSTLPREHELQFRQCGTIMHETLECQKPHRSADGSILSGQFAIPCHDRWVFTRDTGLGLKMQFQLMYRLDTSNEWKPVTADHRFKVGLHHDFAMKKFTSLTPVYNSRDINPVAHLNPMVYSSMCNFMATHVHPDHHINFYNYDDKESFYSSFSRSLDHFKHGSTQYRKMIWSLFEQDINKPHTYFVPLHCIPLFMQCFNNESRMLPLFSPEDSPLILRFTTSENDAGIFYDIKFERKKYKAPAAEDANSRRYTQFETDVATKKAAVTTAEADVVTKNAALVTIRSQAADPEEGAVARAVNQEKAAFEALQKATIDLERAKLEYADAVRAFATLERKLIYEETGYSEEDPAPATDDLGKRCRYKLCLTDIKLSYAYGSLTPELAKDLASSTLPYNFLFPNYLHSSYKMSTTSDSLKFTMEVPQLPSAAFIFAAHRNAFDPLATTHSEPTDRWLAHNIKKVEVFLNDQPMYGPHDDSILNPQRKICRKRNFQGFMNPVTGINTVLDPSLTPEELVSTNYRWPHVFCPFYNSFGARNMPIKYNGNTIVHEAALPSPCRLKFHLYFRLFRLVENMDIHIVLYYPDRLRFVGGGNRKKGSPGQWTTANKLELVHL